jgi:hypothetical protein
VIKRQFNPAIINRTGKLVEAKQRRFLFHYMTPAEIDIRSKEAVID